MEELLLSGRVKYMAEAENSPVCLTWTRLKNSEIDSVALSASFGKLGELRAKLKPTLTTTLEGNGRVIG